MLYNRYFSGSTNDKALINIHENTVAAFTKYFLSRSDDVFYISGSNMRRTEQ